MDLFTLSIEETNLALLPGVRIEASNPRPIGGGAPDPIVLLNETAHRLDGLDLSEFRQDRTFDTFHGRTVRNSQDCLDWYRIDFPRSVRLNCIEMTMGWTYRDGGWWTSLTVEITTGAHTDWLAVKNLTILPTFNFSNTRADRRPYETYLISFDDIVASSIRLVGQPGGLAQFSSLARLAVYHRDFSRWNPSLLPTPPIPYVFKFISPDAIWDLSESLTKLTGMIISFPMMDYYLDEGRFQRMWNRSQANYTGAPELWMLVGDTIGWKYWNAWPRLRHDIVTHLSPAPYIEITLNNTLGNVVAPISIEDRLLGNLSSSAVVLPEQLNLAWNRRYAEEIGLPWPVYEDAMNRTPHMTIEQLEGIAELMGMIANTIARLAHRNLYLENELRKAHSAHGKDTASPREIIQTAITFMEENLEEGISIRDVARSVCLNPSYFSTLFSEHAGCTAIEFLNRLRIERAKEYFRHTNMSVMDVCVALNINPSYFTRLFRKMTGSTPGRFARQEHLD